MTLLNGLRLLFLAVIIAVACSCEFDDDTWGGCVDGSRESVSRNLSLPDFSGIKVDIDANVFIEQGSEQQVRVEGEDNLIELLELDVQDDIWEIEFDRCVDQNESFDIFITLPEVDYISMAGSGRIRGGNTLVTDDMILRLSGSGDIDLGLDAITLDTRLTGSGDIYVEGVVDEMDLKITGSGEMNAFDLTTADTRVKISGSGDAEVLVTDILDVEITGSGDVLYKGNPVLTIEITGSGSVIDAN